MELYGFMEREKKIPSYFFIITKSKINEYIWGRFLRAVTKRGLSPEGGS